MLSSGGNITALSITRSLASVVEAESRGGKWYLTGGFESRAGFDPSSSGSVKEAVAKAIEGAGISAAAGRITSVALSVDDGLSRVGIFRFTEFPQSEEQAMAAVRLRAGKEFALNDVPFRLDYQVLEQGSSVKVLAVVISETIVGACEVALSERGINVERIGLHSFHLANLLEGTAPPGGDFSVAVIIEGRLTLMRFSAGLLDFYSSKFFDGSLAEFSKDLKTGLASDEGRLEADRKEPLFVFGGGAELAGPAGVELTAMSVDSFLDPGGRRVSSPASELLRLAAIGACL